jgi:hypothetical protein
MKVQNHINESAGGMWCRCSRVELRNGTVSWELSRTGSYDLTASYQRSPHVQLAKALDDRALLAFVKAWGPLRVTRLHSMNGTDSIDEYRTERDLLAVEIQLVASIAQPELQRSALMAAITNYPTRDFLVQMGIPWDENCAFDRVLPDWAESASDQEIRAACIRLVSFLPSAEYSPKFGVERGRHGDTVRAWLGIDSLVEALHWMVWQDVYRKRPFLFCEECGALFQPDTEHEKKFCSTRCARRKASREYERRKRAKEKKGNGTHKTR